MKYIRSFLTNFAKTETYNKYKKTEKMKLYKQCEKHWKMNG